MKSLGNAPSVVNDTKKSSDPARMRLLDSGMVLRKLKMFPIRTALLLSALFLVAGCDSIFGPEEERRIGVIAFYDQPIVIDLPDTVQVGVPFVVSIQTYGGGCLSEGPTKIRVRGLLIDVTPYDIHNGAEACEDILNMFPHETTLALPTPGLAQFLFYGRQKPDNLPLTVGREVFVEG